MPLLNRRAFLTGVSAAALGARTAGAEGAVQTQGGGVEAGPLDPKDRGEAVETLSAYFARVAPSLLRPSRGVLRHPSISPTLPGATYSTELWDWDTYWTARGLIGLARRRGDAELLRAVCDHAEGSLLNFLDHQSAEGRMPIMITESDPRPFGSLAPDRPEVNQAKPVMAQLALLVADTRGDAAWLAPHLERIARFHASWTIHNRSDLGLLVWGDDVAIGVDNDPTSFGRPFFSSANLLLNCLYYRDLQAAAELARRLGREEERRNSDRRAREVGEAIQRYCWDPRDRFYYTVDVQCVDRRAELIPHVPRGMAMSWRCLPLRIQMFTGFLPLWCGLAGREQARALRAHASDPGSFEAAAGVRTLSARETMYELVASGNPSDWLGPIWIVSNYLVWKGLSDYGFAAQAGALRDRTLRLLAADLASSGSLNEYYHPDTGAPLSHRGFIDWNLLALEMAAGTLGA